MASTPAVLRPPRSARPPGRRSEEPSSPASRSGDDAAFEALYDAYHRKLLTFCRHMLGSREEAEDAVQHTFLAAYRCLRAGDEVAELKPWLYTIARNRCLSVMRARREEIELEDARPGHRGAGGGGRPSRRPAHARARRPAPSPRSAGGARPLRGRRPFPQGDRGRPGRPAREGQGAGVPGARGADGLADGARDAVRPRARAARDAERRARWAAARSAAMSSSARAARTTRPRCAASAPRWRSRCRSRPPPA